MLNERDTMETRGKWNKLTAEMAVNVGLGRTRNNTMHINQTQCVGIGGRGRPRCFFFSSSSSFLFLLISYFFHSLLLLLLLLRFEYSRAVSEDEEGTLDKQQTKLTRLNGFFQQIIPPGRLNIFIHPRRPVCNPR